MESIRELYRSKQAQVVLMLLLSIIYIAYIFFVIQADEGPVDYETFIRIGSRFVEGKKVYTENSYYPLPYVAVFGVLSLLPRSLSMAIWLGAPVLVALFVTRFRPYALLFAPVFSHFTGGQSAVFGLLGFWGYRENLSPQNKLGGSLLALTLLKPQLGIVPVGFAVFTWLVFIRNEKKIPAQLISFSVTSLLIYLPSFILCPRWVADWLTVPRPMFNRAISSAIPRLLFYVSSPSNVSYWLLWLTISVILVFVVWRIKGASHSLDVLLLISFIISPLVHDYDLIQVLPTIWGPFMPIASSVLSIPGWWTITTKYANDAAWVTFTIIAPGLLACYIYQSKVIGRNQQAA